MKSDTALRSFVKAVSWRVFGALITMGVVFFFTRKLEISLSVGAADTLLKIGVYYAHERGWEGLKWGRRQPKAFVVWFTGLSGSGKSTIAEGVFSDLKRRGIAAEFLDGDGIRDLFPETGFTRPERDLHIRRVGHLAGTLERNGVCVVASLISPYESSRRAVREQCANFVEVHVSTPLAVCEKRDAKGLYALARKGEMKNFTGIDDPYEAPKSAEVSVDTSALGKDQALAEVMGHLNRFL